MPTLKRARAVARAKAVPLGMVLSGRGKYTLAGKAGRGTQQYITRKPVTGRGFYNGFGQDVGKTLGGFLGNLLGQRELGSQLGGALGKFGSSITGFGAYKVKGNSLLPDIPQIRNPHKEGAVQIRHSEYIMDIISSTGFQIQAEIPLNPALSTSFPWLSQSASAFQQYQINGAMFEFKSTSGDISSGNNGALGEVIMSTVYDSVQPPFTNIQQMLNQEFSTSLKPSLTGCHPIECANSQSTISMLYTRTGDPPAGTDIRLYDLGRTTIATNGQQSAGNVLGQLWLTYDILLYKPQLTGVGGGDLRNPASHYELVSDGNWATGYAHSPVGNATLATEIYDNIGLELTGATGGSASVTLPVDAPAGVYHCTLQHDWNWNTNAEGGEFISPSVDQNTVLLHAFDDGTNQVKQTSALGGSGSTQYVYQMEFYVQKISPNLPSVLTINQSGTVTSPPTGAWSKGDLYINMVNTQVIDGTSTPS